MIAASAMSAVMLADQRKFARGYIIRSSLLNESVVTLHACGRESCSGFPMWAPGARREWAPELRRPLRDVGVHHRREGGHLDAASLRNHRAERLVRARGIAG